MTEKKNIHQRIHAAMGDVTYIQKTQPQGMKYSVVSHDAVTAKVRPVLHKHGIIYYPIHIDAKQDGNRTELALPVRFANIDNPEDHIDVPAVGYGVDSQDKGPGKATSYAVKYALLKALGLETGDDADTQNIEHEPTKNAGQRMHGPLNITKLKEGMRAFAGDLEACTDLGMFTGLIEKSTPLLEQCMRDLPDWYYGDGGDVQGAFNRIEHKRLRLSNSDTLEGNADLVQREVMAG